MKVKAMLAYSQINIIWAVCFTDRGGDKPAILRQTHSTCTVGTSVPYTSIWTYVNVGTTNGASTFSTEQYTDGMEDMTTPRTQDALRAPIFNEAHRIKIGWSKVRTHLTSHDDVEIHGRSVRKIGQGCWGCNRPWRLSPENL